MLDLVPRATAHAITIEAVEASLQLCALRRRDRNIVRGQAVPEVLDKLKPLLWRQVVDIDGGIAHELSLDQCQRRFQEELATPAIRSSFNHPLAHPLHDPLRKLKASQDTEGYGAEWDDDFARIVDFTSGGAPYGITWEEERLATVELTEACEDDDPIPF